MEVKDVQRILGDFGEGMRILTEQLNAFLADFDDDELALLADLFETELDNRMVDKEVK